jgi:hypothetical protein
MVVSYGAFVVCSSDARAGYQSDLCASLEWPAVRAGSHTLRSILLVHIQVDVVALIILTLQIAEWT